MARFRRSDYKWKPDLTTHDMVTGYREFKPLVTDLFRAPLLRLLSLCACDLAVILVDQLVVQKVVTMAVGTRWSP